MHYYVEDNVDADYYFQAWSRFTYKNIVYFYYFLIIFTLLTFMIRICFGFWYCGVNDGMIGWFNGVCVFLWRILSGGYRMQGILGLGFVWIVSCLGLGVFERVLLTFFLFN